MVKFKVRSSMKQYVKKKPIKWGFKFWWCCASEKWYFNQFDLHGVKKKPQKKIWDQVLGWKWLNPFNIAIVCFCFDNFFDSFTSILKLYDRSVYSFGTAWKARKGMPEMLIVKIMKLYSGKVAWCKWFERRLGSILFSNVEELIITSTVSCQQEGPSSKILVPQPDIIKICNKGMDGVEVI